MTDDGLWTYQDIGADWLVEHERGYLGDDCGLGKTPQAVVAAKRIGAKRVLCVAPASALTNWRRAWERWGPEKTTFAALSYADRRVEDTAGIWDLVILDEAHYLKRATAQRSQRVWRVAAQAPVCWPLSGTPAPNNAYELYAPLRVLWPKLLKAHGVNTARDFADRYCKWYWTTRGPRITGVNDANAAELKEILSQVMLRRKEADVDLQLPPLRVDVHYLPHDPDLDKELEEAGVDDETPDATYRRVLGTWKVGGVADVISEELAIGQYQQIVVGAYHLAALAYLRERFKKFGVCYLDGSTTQKKRDEAVDRFTSDPTNRVMLMQQTAGGVSLNLQCSSEVALVEPSWVPDDNYQFIKRIHRFGSKRPCRARFFAVSGTRDEVVMAGNARKTRTHKSLGLDH